jgi:hypothetical protein
MPEKFGSTTQAPLHFQEQISYGNIAVCSDKTHNAHAVWPNCMFLMSVPAVRIHIVVVRVDVGYAR